MLLRREFEFAPMRLKSVPIIYLMGSKPLAAPTTTEERQLFESISRCDAELELFVTDGLIREELQIIKTKIYRLKSAKHHATAEFYFLKEFGMFKANILWLAVDKDFQGNFFTLKSFFLGNLCSVLFDYGVDLVFGWAGGNPAPVRQAKDWREMPTKDGKTIKLIRLYERLGMLHGGDGYMVLPRADFEAQRSKPRCHAGFNTALG